MYFPKTQIKPNLKANPGEFITSQGKEYVGDYFKTSKGDFFTGKSPSNPPNNPIYEVSSQDFTKEKETKQTSYFIEDGKRIAPAPLPPTPSPTLPTKQDYKTGQMIRYFVKKSNESIFVEIQKDEYNKFSQDDSSVQHQLYIPFSLSWVIRGEKDEVEKLNKNITILKQGQQKLFGLTKYIKNYCLFLVK